MIHFRDHFATQRPGCMVHMLALAFFVLITAARADALTEPSDLHGRVVYFDFWASWCAPCRQSFPWMQQMQDLYAPQGLVVIAVDVDRRRQDADKFLAEFHPTFAVRFDPKGELAERYHVQGMPTGLIFDRQGVVRFTHVGFRPVDRAAFEKQLHQLLNEK